MSVFGVFLVRIFPQSNQKKLRIRTFSTQWMQLVNYMRFSIVILKIIVFAIQHDIAQKMNFPTKNFFSKCDQIHWKLRILSHLLKKSLMENFIFCPLHYLLKDHSFSTFVKFSEKLTFQNTFWSKIQKRSFQIGSGKKIRNGASMWNLIEKSRKKLRNQILIRKLKPNVK